MARKFIQQNLPKFRTPKENSANTQPSTKITSLPKSLTRFYIKYALRGQWRLLFVWIVVVAWMRMAMVLWPLTQKWFVAMFERPLTGVEQFILENMPTLLLIIGLNISWSIGGALRDVVAAKRHANMEKQISETMTDYLQRQSVSFWAERKSGSINTQIGYICRGIDVMGEVLQMLMMVITMTLNVWLMTQVNIWITIIFAVMFVSRLIYTLFMMKPVKKSAKSASEAQSYLSGHIVDSLTNSFIVRVFAGADAEHEYLDGPRKDRVKKHVKSRLMQVLMWAPFAVMWDFGYGIVLLTCLYLFAIGQLVVSEVVFTVFVYDHVIGAISNLITTIPNLVENISYATNAYSELSKPIQILDAPNAPNLNVKRGKIEFKNVSFKYKRKWVLRDLNLTIKPGERVGIVGASGAGKSTLVHLLMRFYDVNDGAVLIDGTDIRDVTQDSLHRSIGFIPQEPTLFDRTLRENIAYGAQNATDAQIRRAAKRAAADDFIMATEKKYDSYVGERGIKLSGGQKQRVAIARAFLKNAPILVLDEATSALDSETEIAIQNSFEDLARGRTTLVIAHRLSTLRNMDRIIVMQDGKIIEQGSHRSLLRHKKGAYAKLWNMQSGGFLTTE